MKLSGPWPAGEDWEGPTEGGADGGWEGDTCGRMGGWKKEEEYLVLKKIYIYIYIYIDR